MGKAVRKIERILPGKARRWGGEVVFLVIAVVVAVVVGLKAGAVLQRRAEVAQTGVRLERVAKAEVERRETAKREMKRIQKLEEGRRERMETSKLVALTFDDGPGAETTPRLLDILRDKGAKATFFVVGTRVEAMPDVVAREVAEGHEVGSHTTRHLNLEEDINTAEEMREEMGEMRRIIREAGGREPTLFRTPYGKGKIGRW